MVKSAMLGSNFKFFLPQFLSVRHSSSDQEIADVCIFTEGTYPYLKGGVSSVIHQIIENHPGLKFGIVHIAWDNTCPQINLYPELDNIRWVKTIFLNDPKKKIEKNKVSGKNFNEFISDFFQLDFKQEENLKDFYNKYVNPLTRKIDFKKVITDSRFFEAMVQEFKHFDITLNELFWLQKEYISLASSILDLEFPKAKVYHSHTNGYAGLAASLASIQHNKNFILTEHSLYIRDVLDEIGNRYGKGHQDISKIRKNIWEKWFKAIGQLTYSRAYKNTYLYDQIALDAEVYGSIKNRSIIIPNGINIDRFQLARTKQKERNKLRFREGLTWKLGFIGRIVPVKGVKDLIEAVGHLKEKFNGSFEIHLIGPTEEDVNYYNECLELTKSKGLEGIISFHGSQDVATFLEGIDLVVLSSLSEALPVVILESMAAGVPIVSTNVGSVESILINPLEMQGKRVSKTFSQAAGRIVPSRDPKALSESILTTLMDKKSYESFRKNGPRRVQHSFNILDVMEKYKHLYKEHL